MKENISIGKRDILIEVGGIPGSTTQTKTGMGVTVGVTTAGASISKVS